MGFNWDKAISVQSEELEDLILNSSSNELKNNITSFVSRHTIAKLSWVQFKFETISEDLPIVLPFQCNYL